MTPVQQEAGAGGSASAQATPKVKICLVPGELPSVVDQIEAALIEHDPAIYQSAGVLMLAHDSGADGITAVDLRLRTMQVADFYKRLGFLPFYIRKCTPSLMYFQALLTKKWDCKFPRKF